MCIFVKTLTGRTLTINLGNTEEEMQSVTVGQLKTKIFQKEGIPDQQRLIFDGKELEDTKRLIEYGIQHESEIHLVSRVPGGEQPPETDSDDEVSDRSGETQAQRRSRENLADFSCCLC
uniref:Ubiquitin-like domain-containing protein n=1 Tax=Poecilia latipinna TaxID=48699 RepID=A0A3B3VZH4_9TELE